MNQTSTHLWYLVCQPSPCHLCPALLPSLLPWVVAEIGPLINFIRAGANVFMDDSNVVAQLANTVVQEPQLTNVQGVDSVSRLATTNGVQTLMLQHFQVVSQQLEAVELRPVVHGG